MNVPDAVGVPLIVITFAAHVALTPAGKPFAPDTPELEIPVAPVVAIVILVSAEFLHNVGEEDGVAAVLVAVTVTMRVSVALAHPPAPVTV